MSRVTLQLAAAALMLGAAAPARAQQYPAKPVRIIASSSQRERDGEGTGREGHRP